MDIQYGDFRYAGRDKVQDAQQASLEALDEATTAMYSGVLEHVGRNYTVGNYDDSIKRFKDWKDQYDWNPFD